MAQAGQIFQHFIINHRALDDFAVFIALGQNALDFREKKKVPRSGRNSGG